jgi:hypothetical protein
VQNILPKISQKKIFEMTHPLKKTEKFPRKKFLKMTHPLKRDVKNSRKIFRTASYPLYSTDTGGYIRGVTGGGVRGRG